VSWPRAGSPHRRVYLCVLTCPHPAVPCLALLTPYRNEQCAFAAAPNSIPRLHSRPPPARTVLHSWPRPPLLSPVAQVGLRVSFTSHPVSYLPINLDPPPVHLVLSSIPRKYQRPHRNIDHHQLPHRQNTLPRGQDLNFYRSIPLTD
jgi:hypothetical protein